MIPTREMVEDARQAHLGLPVAYVDRMRYIGRVRPRQRQEGALEPFFKIPTKVGEIAAGSDWDQIWKEIAKDPLAAAAALSFSS